MRKLVIGDIHGRYNYLMDVLKKANVDYENDLVIQIGDMVDRGPKPFECMDELMKIKNRVFIIGNHDHSFIDMVAGSGDGQLGRGNGVEETLEAWERLDVEEQFRYLNTFFREQVPFYVTEDNICFVHGGFDRDYPIKVQGLMTLCWDRDLVKEAIACKGDAKLITVDKFKEIFIGHTPTIYWSKVAPIISGGVINIDTGSGKGGPLTIMDVDTKEYWQSELDPTDKAKLQKYGIIT